MNTLNKNGIPIMPSKPSKKISSKKGPAGYQGKLALCPVCRLVDRTTRHHLRPRAAGFNNVDNSQNVLRLCHACHNFLHQTFTNEHLSEHLHTQELICGDAQVQAFVAERRKEGVHAAH